MFSATDDPGGFFALRPMPASVFDIASPFGSGAQLFLQRFTKNSAELLPQHAAGISIAAAQARLTFGASGGAIEIFGMTDRSGKDAFNQALSTNRAKNAENALRSAMSLGSFNASFSNGLGEEFEKQYFPKDQDGSSNDRFRGVICYLWESISTARDVGLRIQIGFAGPPLTEGDARTSVLGPLHLGRLRATPRSSFA